MFTSVHVCVHVCAPLAAFTRTDDISLALSADIFIVSDQYQSLFSLASHPLTHESLKSCMLINNMV